MKKLFELLKLNQVKGDFGIEIEVEGKNLVPLEDGIWTTHDDGSLRGRFPDSRAEYIFAKPLPRKDVRKALDYLADHLKNAKLDFSFRTSVHVHMNVQQLTYPQYLNVIYTYLLLEEPFLNYCGKERKGNRFCLRLQDAEGLLDALNRLFAVERVGMPQLNAVAGDNIRYASVNLGATRTYGSLEFRAMRGNLNPEFIDTWVEALHRVREFAQKCEDPSEVFKKYAELEPKDFMVHVLGDIADKFIYARVVKDIQRSFSLSFDLPYAYSASLEEEKRKEEEMKAMKERNAEVGALDGDNFKRLMWWYKAFLDIGHEPRNAERMAREEVAREMAVEQMRQELPAAQPRKRVRRNPAALFVDEALGVPLQEEPEDF